MKPTMYMLVGLPASGKSTYAKTLNGTIFSSDALRKELWGSEETQGDNNVLFTELHRRIKDCLRNGNNAIYDACNINYKKRKAFLDELKNIPCEKICIFIAVPYDICLKQNANRDRKVPEYVIERMYKQFNAPYWYEGWDDIWIINEYEDIISLPKWISEMWKFNQDNHHHTYSLGEHCSRTADEIAKTDFYNRDLVMGAYIHDNGKCFVKDYHNNKGEPTEEAHYYQHENVGCYNSFFFDNIVDHLYVAQLIQWHMRSYIAWKTSDKSMNKERQLLGEELFNDILKLHKADKMAH